MEISKLVADARSVRRFVQDTVLSTGTLRELVELARLSPSSANRQGLKFYLGNTPEICATIFERLSWAGYLPDWPGPAEGERPAAYIVVIGDDSLGPPREVDAGIALQSMVIGAHARGLGTCILGNVDRDKLHDDLGLEPDLKIMYVLALGKPAEKVVVEKVPADGNIRYWRDSDMLLHVPKRELEDIIL